MPASVASGTVAAVVTDDADITQPPMAASEREYAERKLASVLFADLVGSTALAATEDPERTRTFLDPFYEATAVRPLRATVCSCINADRDHGSYFTLSSGKVVPMAPSRAEQDRAPPGNCSAS
jgi:hypothetical protein